MSMLISWVPLMTVNDVPSLIGSFVIVCVCRCKTVCMALVANELAKYVPPTPKHDIILNELHSMVVKLSRFQMVLVSQHLNHLTHYLLSVALGLK